MPIHALLFHALVLLAGVFGVARSFFSLNSRLHAWKKFWLGYSERRRFSPPVSVLMAVRGMNGKLDEEIDKTLKSLAAQSYAGKYEVLVVTDDDRKAYDFLRKRCAKLKNFRVLLSKHPSTKAIALLLAVKKSRHGVLAFCDSDEELPRDWLQSVVGPLESSSGAASGYRIYIPSSFFSLIVAAWNNIGLMRSIRKPYIIGGSYAIRKETFMKLKINERWKTAVAEDAAVTQCVESAGLEIRFVPSAAVFSEYSNHFSHITEFTTRQLTLIRWHMPGLWKIAAALFVFESASTMLGAALLLLYALNPSPLILLESLLLLWPAVFGLLKASVDRRNLEKITGRNVPALRYLLADFLAQWLMTYNLIAAGFKKTIRWRGRKYAFRNGKVGVEL